jgi:hypothetical protein
MRIGSIGILIDVGLDFFMGINSSSLSEFESLELDDCLEIIGLKKEKFVFFLIFIK